MSSSDSDSDANFEERLIEGLDGELNEDGQSELHMACIRGDLILVKKLLQEGWDINADNVDIDGNTPLTWASAFGRVDVVQHLLSQGADPELANNGGDTPIFGGVEFGRREVVKILAKHGVNLDHRNNDKRTVMHVSAQHNKVNIHKDLIKLGVRLDRKDKDGNTCLHIAVREDGDDMVGDLIKAGADMYDVGPGGNTVMHMACERGAVDIMKLLVKKDKDGTLLSSTNDEDLTPPLEALRAGHVDCVKYLVKSQLLDLTTQLNDPLDDEGNTILHVLAERRWNMCEYLVEQGADIYKCNKQGDSFWFLANTPVMEFLLKNKYVTDINSWYRDGGLYEEPVGHHGATPLHFYAGRGTVGSAAPAELLLKYGADVDVRNWHNGTPLHRACAQGKISVVKALMAAGADVHATNAKGDTPLHQAARKGKVEVVKYLLDETAAREDASTENKKGNTPKDVAKDRGHKKIAKMLTDF